MSGGSGTSQPLSPSVRFGQSASCQRGLGLLWWEEEGRRGIEMGVWSDPVAGRVDASQEGKAGKIRGLAKARSIALDLWVPVKGNQV